MDTIIPWANVVISVMGDYLGLFLGLCDAVTPKTALLGGIAVICLWRLVTSLLEFAWYGEPVTAVPLCGGAVAFFSVTAIVH